jgi:hypothetical protein
MTQHMHVALDERMQTHAARHTNSSALEMPVRVIHRLPALDADHSRPSSATDNLRTKMALDVGVKKTSKQLYFSCSPMINAIIAS